MTPAPARPKPRRAGDPLGTRAGKFWRAVRRNRWHRVERNSEHAVAIGLQVNDGRLP